MRDTDTDVLSAIMRFMRGTHLLAPHHLPQHVADHVADLGLMDLHLYVADLQQKALVPFLPPAGPESSKRPTVLPVDSTLAGHAYQHVQMVHQDTARGTVLVWVPLLNGTERLGVLAAALGPSTPDGDALDDRLRLLASLVAELLITKAAYGDSLVRLRRSAPMGLAAEIQWSLLPPLTFADDVVSIAAALEPAYEVAGDSVDYAVDPHVTRMAVFDGMGHDLSSAQLVSLVVAAYRNARRLDQSLTETSRRIDEAVSQVFVDEGFVTGVLAELDTDTGVFTWMTAGHPPPLLLRNGRLVKTLDLAPMMPFGLGLDDASGSTPRVGSEKLEPGDHVLLYTDGFVESRSPEGELFGVPRLTDLILRSLAAGLPGSETMRRAVNVVLEHHGSNLQDDATMLLVQWHPAHPSMLLP
jgi:serine phosphatase RsbU (regulator of sigma subunit)